MKKIALYIAIFIGSILMYEALLLSPKKQLKVIAALVEEYEKCKNFSTLQYHHGWLGRCHNEEPLEQECRELLKENPWKLYAQHTTHTQTENVEEKLNYPESYKKYLEKREGCSCEALPEAISEKLRKQMDERNSFCLRELEVLSQALK